MAYLDGLPPRHQGREIDCVECGIKAHTFLFSPAVAFASAKQGRQAAKSLVTADGCVAPLPTKVLNLSRDRV